MRLAMLQFTEAGRDGVSGDPGSAAETVVTPPQPSADASAAAHCLRMRSSITADRAEYFCRIRSIAVASCMQQPWSKHPIPAIRICSSYFFAVPKFSFRTFEER
jgi:hypothetical protein